MSISTVDSGPLHVKPEVDLNLSTEADRILYVLSKIIARAKFVGVLKELIKDDGAMLNEILDQNVITHVLIHCNKRQMIGESASNISASIASKQKSASEQGESSSSTAGSEETFSISVEEEEHSVKAETREKRKFDDLNEVIYMLEENPDIRHLAEGLESEMSSDMKHFVNCLVEFRHRMEVLLHESATQHKTREKYMREIYEKNEKAKREIERLEEELLVTKTDANVCLIGRNILIKRHLKKMERIQQNSLEAIDKKVNESEKAMVNSWKISSATQEALRRDLQQATENYENMMRDHLDLEKSLRGRRSKLETQVLGWIQKFDQDIGEKQAEEERIQALLDKEIEEVKEIQKQIDEQEDEYDELMQEKAQYEDELLERRMYHFIANRSARRIQRSYRLYKARKLAKKLAKKSKKGKKGKKKAKK